jgi:hypothetical protein
MAAAAAPHDAHGHVHAAKQLIPERVDIRFFPISAFFMVLIGVILPAMFLYLGGIARSSYFPPVISPKSLFASLAKSELPQPGALLMSGKYFLNSSSRVCEKPAATASAAPASLSVASAGSPRIHLRSAFALALSAAGTASIAFSNFG